MDQKEAQDQITRRLEQSVEVLRRSIDYFYSVEGFDADGFTSAFPEVLLQGNEMGENVRRIMKNILFEIGPREGHTPRRYCVTTKWLDDPDARQSEHGPIRLQDAWVRVYEGLTPSDLIFFHGRGNGQPRVAIARESALFQLTSDVLQTEEGSVLMAHFSGTVYSDDDILPEVLFTDSRRAIHQITNDPPRRMLLDQGEVRASIATAVMGHPAYRNWRDEEPFSPPSTAVV